MLATLDVNRVAVSEINITVALESGLSDWICRIDSDSFAIIGDKVTRL